MRVGGHRAELVQSQPSVQKLIHKRVAARVGQQSFRFRSSDLRVGQLLRIGSLEELFVGRRCGQEIGNSRSDFVIGQ